MRLSGLLNGALVCAAFAACAGAPAAGASDGHGAIGTPAPAYAATTLRDGAPVALAQLRGTAVLLNKWSTWCRPCVREMPELERLQRDHRHEAFTVVGVAIDPGGAAGAVRSVARRRGVTYPIWLDPEDTFTSTFQSSGVPESILIDRDGVVVMRWPGALEAHSAAVDHAIAGAIRSAGTYSATAGVTDRGGIRSGAFVLAVLAALLAGLLSFLSPCVLPLVPSYVAFIAGAGGAMAEGAGPRQVRTLALGCCFVGGFSAVFVALGATSSFLSGVFRDNGELIATVGGVLLVVFGVMLLGVLRVPFAERDVRLLHRVTSRRRYGYPATFVVGAAFAAGWTPCIGPVLAGILTLAAATDTVARGVALLAAYSVGLALPFLAATVALDRFVLASARVRPHLGVVNRVSGALLVVLGLLLATGAMSRLSSWAGQVLPAWLG